MARSAPKSAAALSASTRIAILHGDDRFMQELRLGELRAALAEAHGEDGFDVVRFDAAAPGAGSGLIAEILDECRTFGLIARHKLVIVENTDVLLKAADDEDGAASKASPRGAPKAKTNRQLMEDYAADPSESATLVLRASTWRPGNLDKAVAALGARGAVIVCDSPKPDDAVRWVRERCQEHYGAPIAPDAAAMLVENVGTDYGRLDTELAKLTTVNPGKPVTAETVREFVGFSREEEFWRFKETLLSGNPAAALTHLRDMIEVSRHQPVPLAWNFTDLARQIYGASQGLAIGEPPASIARRLKLWGGMQEAVLRAARRIPPDRAARLLATAVETDVRLKTGQGDPVINLETLTLRFTSALA